MGDNGSFSLRGPGKIEMGGGGGGQVVPYSGTQQGSYLDLKDPRAQLLGYLNDLMGRMNGRPTGNSGTGMTDYGAMQGYANVIRAQAGDGSTPLPERASMGGGNASRDLADTSFADKALARAHQGIMMKLQEEAMRQQIANMVANRGLTESRTNIRNQTFGGGQLSNILRDALTRIRNNISSTSTTRTFG